MDGIVSSKGSGGEGGIRTHGNLTATHALQACLLDHSSTSPLRSQIILNSGGEGGIRTHAPL